MADTRPADFDEDLSRARGWLRNVLNRSGSTNTSKPYCSHDLTSWDCRSVQAHFELCPVMCGGRSSTSVPFHIGAPLRAAARAMTCADTAVVSNMKAAMIPARTTKA